MRHVPRALLAGGLGLAVSFLVACGGGKGLLSGDQASTLNSQLDQVSSAVASGNCSAALSAVNSFSSNVSSIGSLNPTLRDNLTQDATKLAQLATRDCRNATTTTTTPTTTTTTTTTTTHVTPPTTSTGTKSSPSQSTPATPPGNPGTTSTGASGGAGVGGQKGNGGSSGGAGANNGNGQ
jgi:hypothetical protein